MRLYARYRTTSRGSVCAARRRTQARLVLSLSKQERTEPRAARLYRVSQTRWLTGKYFRHHSTVMRLPW